MDIKLDHDTICAIATPVGEGGIGIVKLSGPDSLPIIRGLFQPDRPVDSYRSHQLYHGWIIDPVSRESVDEVLMSFMSAPHTYTRDDVVEINCHSGYMVLNRILELVLQAGARLAEPGEFTRRAFLNGRIDLSQAEAVLDVIHARSEQSLLVAGRHLRGDFREAVFACREALLRLLSEIEAHIDFAEDLEGEGMDRASTWMRELQQELIAPLERMLANYRQGRILREGLTLVLLGKPNVGKSSLLNVLVGRDRAIVTPYPGTTRDVIEDSLLIEGITVRILDTAGIREEPDDIESMGIQRALSSITEADAALWLIDRSRPLTDEDDAVFEAIGSTEHIVLLNKSDLHPAVSFADVREKYSTSAPVVAISVFHSGDVERLLEMIASRYLRRPLEVSHSALVPNLRQKARFEGALDALHRAGELLRGAGRDELVSLEFQTARKHLDGILGIEIEDDLLDRIFSEFCIGK